MTAARSPGRTVFPSASPLTCPRCDSACVHHGEVHVYSRPTEGAPGSRTIVDLSGAVSTIDVVAGFVGRGSDVRVALACEMCGVTSWLTLAPHKGRTFLTWQGKTLALARLRSEDDARGLAERLAQRFGVRTDVREDAAQHFPWTLLVGIRGEVRASTLCDFVAGFLGGTGDEGELVEDWEEM